MENGEFCKPGLFLVYVGLVNYSLWAESFVLLNKIYGNIGIAFVHI